MIKGIFFPKITYNKHTYHDSRVLKIYGIQLFLPRTKIKDAHSCRPYKQQTVYACTCRVTFSFFGSHLPSLICIGQLSFLLFLLTSLALDASVSNLGFATQERWMDSQMNMTYYTDQYVTHLGQIVYIWAVHLSQYEHNLPNLLWGHERNSNTIYRVLTTGNKGSKWSALLLNYTSL